MTNKAARSEIKPASEAGVFEKRIGYTVYRVGVYFSGTNKETARDKILRLVRMEAKTEKAVINR